VDQNYLQFCPPGVNTIISGVDVELVWLSRTVWQGGDEHGFGWAPCLIAEILYKGKGGIRQGGGGGMISISNEDEYD
jgi:hypothetical protein